MNWTLLLIGFALAVLMGASLAALLAQLRPQWSASRRLLAAASGLPAVTAVVTLIALGIVSLGPQASAKTIALQVVAIVGGGFALLAFIGGLVGAGLAQRKRGQ